MSVRCNNCSEIFENKSKFDEHEQFCITKGKSICKSCKTGKKLVTKYNCAACLSFWEECKTCKRCIKDGKDETGCICKSCFKKDLKLSNSRSRKHKCSNCTNTYKRLKYLRRHLELLINESCLQNCP